MIDSVATLLHVLRRSRLLDPSQLNEVKANVAQDCEDPELVARRLADLGWLTPYQIGRIFEGTDQELVVGRYRILSLLGEGGLCQVFRAWDTGNRWVVALKVVHLHLRTQQEVLQQLRQEVEVMARLSHPNFIKVLQAPTDEASYYFAMEFIDGLDLAKVLQQTGPLPMAQACDYVRQVARGLQYAYEQGLVHRDIKPANLIVSYKGDHVRILDIGLARLEWSFRDLSTGSSSYRKDKSAVPLMGTPDYIAPEQALSPEQANIRADIYSLGCTLYHLLAGQPPFPGKSLTQKLVHHQQTPPPSVCDRRPDLPPELAAVIQKMMAKSPDDRYQTPAGVVVALIRFCSGGTRRVAIERLRLPQHQQYQFDPDPMPLNEPPPPPPPPPSSAPGPQAGSGVRPVGAPERRKATRRAGNPVPVRVTPVHGQGEPLSGWVLDRSLGGLGLLVDEALEVGTVMNVVAGSGTLVSRPIPVRIVYCTALKTNWRVGCQFQETLSHGDLRLFG
jgi:eukaryotic-like serine/threonine-protein kinase